MARRNKENIIFDNDATLIIQKDPEETAPVEPKQMRKARTINKPIEVVDVLDTIAGYIMPTFYMVQDSEKQGECLLCGKQTAYKMRKLCVDCMKKHAREYYEKARAAIENGETTIQ